MSNTAAPLPTLETSPPSEWVKRWTHLVTAGSTLLDVACGSGRHLRWFAARGVHVTGVDRSPEAVAAAKAAGIGLLADLEAGAWPLPGQLFDTVLVTNYLHRPLLPAILASVAPGGMLIYETFAQGQETVGRPARTEFLLAPGELLRACESLHVLAYEDGWLPVPRRVQRVVARRVSARGTALDIVDDRPAALALNETLTPHTGPLHLRG